ncbi:MAG: hypothetical protein K2O22_03590 [Anaeroplasmataceae bacterium]|nr:hypothetical protein [Anaeroplasmataceae bacterium]
MKRLIALCSTLCLGILIVLTSCGSGNGLPNIEGSLNVQIFKTDLSVVAKYVDTDDHDLYDGKVKSYISLSSTGDEAKEISRKDVTISKPATQEKNLEGTKLDFSNLTADTKYVLKLVISSEGKQKTLSTKEVTTLNSGTSAEDPIIIDSLDMLLGMSKTKDAFYKLTTDIDCGGSLTSIFNSSSMFSGTLDGDNHKIYNFKMESNQYSGLFGYMSGATVKNLVIEDVNYDNTRSNTYLGALAGYAKHCSISNVQVKSLTFKHSGQTSTFAYVGGLVGLAENCSISNCSVDDANITIPSARLKMYVGGFIGENKNSEIKDCSVVGTVETTIAYTSNEDGCLYVGGFSGINDSGRGILNCYSKVNVKVSDPETTSNTGFKTFKLCVGGFNGGNLKDASKFENCASIGDIDVTILHAYFAYVGGFTGYVDDQNIATYDNCIYVPKEFGVKAKFAVTPTEEDKKVEQQASISLAAGKDERNSKRVHIIVYRDALEIENEHEKLEKPLYVIDQNLSEFSETIRNVINSEIEA